MTRLLLSFLMCFVFFTTINSQITIDGTITEPDWGTALSTSAGGAIPSDSFGAGHEINAIYAEGTGTDILFGIAGNVLDGNRILLFVDSKSGGYSNCDFGRNGAPAGVGNLNSGIIFDDTFLPDYCIVIGTNNTNSNYFFDLFTLDGTANNSSSGGPNLFLGDTSAPKLGASPVNGDITKGFEMSLAKTALGYTGGDVKVMAMYSGDSGFLSNQFLSKANNGELNFGNGEVNFNDENPDFVNIPEAVLPAEFTSFTAKPNKNTIDLTWQTAQEINNDYFQIERKTTQDRAWKVIGKEQGAGNSETTVRYAFTDEKPANGVNYYRLKQTDFDGQFEYSEMVSAEVRKLISIDIFPNPTASELTIVTPADFTEGEIKLYDATGRMIISATVSGRNSLNLSDLNAGIYFFKLLDAQANIVAEDKVRKL